MARVAMTPARDRTLRSIYAYRRAYGYAPTLQELADLHEVTKSAVYQHVQQLCAGGWLRSTPRAKRAIRLTRKGVDHCMGASVPVPSQEDLVRQAILGLDDEQRARLRAQI